ncbi:hypothetical protein SAMD00019534_045790 [Acytostelium subglobosum LB1]|uniref:hypothetical protein n=1 Tax=Acytostelium subglobosum LB1 TaxID=1410327 RepID=UPI0006450871|nr:hypothetical protein SAMD00019534_045790 [Acytostelium subglobosum LB1]GAM21404.1 hypothetical protein SAMD00019534_045790 [Acytostelium subglobosum LB1]|eukprot:XP_012755523.1 hypothetical protein SAMD00019534_045790 [Acytostelium subglobosum LB1]
MSTGYQRVVHKYNADDDFFKDDVVDQQYSRKTNNSKQRCLAVIEDNQQQQQQHQQDDDYEEVNDTEMMSVDDEDNDHYYEHQQQQQQQQQQHIVCEFGNCQGMVVFNTIAAYQNHYNSVHSYECQYCHRSFQSNRWLECHVLETHDTMFKLLAKKRQMYECLVDDCTMTFGNEQTRLDHLVSTHKYSTFMINNVLALNKAGP